jgi:hypothetical protein
MTDPSSLPSFPPPAAVRPLRGRALDALIDEGFAPNIDSDGDVAFTVQDQQLFVRCMEGELSIMRVFGQWQIGEDVPQDPLAQLSACNELTLGLNVVKAGIANETLVVTGEHVIGPDADVRGLLVVTTQLVLSAVHMWHETIMGRPMGDGPVEGTVEGRDESDQGDTDTETGHA